MCYCSHVPMKAPVWCLFPIDHSCNLQSSAQKQSYCELLLMIKDDSQIVQFVIFLFKDWTWIVFLHLIHSTSFFLLLLVWFCFFLPVSDSFLVSASEAANRLTAENEWEGRKAAGKIASCICLTLAITWQNKPLSLPSLVTICLWPKSYFYFFINNPFTPQWRGSIATLIVKKRC